MQKAAVRLQYRWIYLVELHNTENHLVDYQFVQERHETCLQFFVFAVVADSEIESNFLLSISPTVIFTTFFITDFNECLPIA